MEERLFRNKCTCSKKFMEPYKLCSPSRKLCEVCSKRCKTKKLDVIRRVLHYDDYLQSLKTEELTAYAMESGNFNELRSKDNTDFDKDDLKVLFFAPKGHREEHNYYGNVAFDIKFEKVIERFKNFYYIEHYTYPKSVCFHVLVTRKSLKELKSMFPHMNGIIDYSSSSRFCPVNFEEPNSYTYIYEIPFYDEYPCDVDLIIDCDQEDDTKWFYENCTKIAVNHERANEKSFLNDGKFAPRICRNFNNFPPSGHKTACPYPYTIEETERKMVNDQLERYKPLFKNITTKMEEWKPIFSVVTADCYKFSKYKPLLEDLDTMFEDFLNSLREVSNVNQDEMECD